MTDTNKENLISNYTRQFESFKYEAKQILKNIESNENLKN